MRLPNAERAVVDIVKLRDYCLSETHLRGRHKARVFKATLGVTADHAEELRQALLAAAVAEEAQLAYSDDFGARYTIDFELMSNGGRATIRSTWIVRTGEDFARLTTCYVLV